MKNDFSSVDVEEHLNLLRDFVLISHSGSIANAAEWLKVSERSIVKKMQEVDDLFGIRAFDHKDGIIKLTLDGYELLLTYGPGILSLLRALREDIYMGRIKKSMSSSFDEDNNKDKQIR